MSSAQTQGAGWFGEAPPGGDLEALIRSALAEDAPSGDVTTLAVVPAGTWGGAGFQAKGCGVLAGVPLVGLVYGVLSREVSVRTLYADGQEVAPGDVIAQVEGPAGPLLTGERTVLNLLQYLSGIATATARLCRLIEGTGARLVDTRKTLPGYRALAKYAFRCGGGVNHRFSLSDGILIKDNHIRAAGGIATAITRARESAHHLLRVEVEVETLAQLQEALEAGSDCVLLDNMELPVLREAVQMAGGRALVEASGGINEQTIRAVAETGVDLISAGAPTHSVRALDISLDWR